MAHETQKITALEAEIAALRAEEARLEAEIRYYRERLAALRRVPDLVGGET